MKITNACVTGFFGIVYIVAALWLYRRTRRFYALGIAETYPCVAIQETPSRDGRSIGIEFFSADADRVRMYLVADDAGEIFSDKLPLNEAQKNTLIDAYFDLLTDLGKFYSYQEFIPFDLTFLRNKKIFCKKQLFAQIFGAVADSASAMNGNEFCLYEPSAEWPPIKEEWLTKDSTKGI